MANVLKMAKVHSIQVLHARGWSQRRIARELGIHRETVARYVQLAEGLEHPDTPTPAVHLPYPVDRARELIRMRIRSIMTGACARSYIWTVRGHARS